MVWRTRPQKCSASQNWVGELNSLEIQPLGAFVRCPGSQCILHRNWVLDPGSGVNRGQGPRLDVSPNPAAETRDRGPWHSNFLQVFSWDHGQTSTVYLSGPDPPSPQSQVDCADQIPENEGEEMEKIQSIGGGGSLSNQFLVRSVQI